MNKSVNNRSLVPKKKLILTPKPKKQLILTRKPAPRPINPRRVA